MWLLRSNHRVKLHPQPLSLTSHYSRHTTPILNFRITGDVRQGIHFHKMMSDMPSAMRSSLEKLGITQEIMWNETKDKKDIRVPVYYGGLNVTLFDTFDEGESKEARLYYLCHSSSGWSLHGRWTTEPVVLVWDINLDTWISLDGWTMERKDLID
jgi:hypothetical protein